MEDPFSDRAVVDLTTGQVDPDATGYVRDLLEQIESLKETNLRKDIRIKRLLRETDGLKHSPHYEAALRVLGHWRDLCHPKARELESHTRLSLVIDRLKAKPPYTEDELMRCIEGYVRFPYVVQGRRATHGTPAQRQDGAELIFRDAKHVDQGLRLYDEAQHRDEAVPVSTEPQIALLSPLGTMACKLADFGWSVFPIRPRMKVPATRHGLNDATRDKDRITRFWSEHPDHNIGVRCGIPSNLVVLDVDGDEGGESLRALEHRFEPLPRTASVVTPSGGEHFYFRHPSMGEVRNTTGYPGPGLDIRGNGGYVLAPPSIGPSGRLYEFDERAAPAEVPQWILKLLASRPQPEAFDRDYAEMVRQGARHGERNDSLLKLAGHLWSRVEPDEVAELVQAVNLSKCSPPLPPPEVTKIVQSVAKMRARQALEQATAL